ncbi:serine hydrolase domain-containing protein [Evansella sp. AB-rgal1]|uniref:serine hydrolase domain-containing protein n=1 Tax=Evansella sp. AB-rgal1 TaxID=3242696 RepID=UPI00359EFE5D
MIDKEIEYNMRTHNIPGMAFSLVDRNGVVYSKGYGTLDVGDKSELINESTNFHLGSVSKVFVSMGILKLQEEGYIDIEQPVVDYLPWFSTKDALLSNEIKIEHLLNHSSGLPGRLNVHEISNLESREIINKIKDKLNNVTLVGKPGTVYEYTNMNTDLLQLVIEEVTGKSFTQYMEETFFTPLNMNRTGYFTFDNSHLSNTAMGHRYHWGKLKPYKEELVYATSASAGLSSNVDDLSKFLGLLLNDGQGPNGKLISRSSIDQMFKPNQYGIGYNLYVYPHNISMDGGLPGFTSTIVLSSDKTFGLILLANSKQDITYHSGFNLYRIVNGDDSPTKLLEKDFPKIHFLVQIILFIVIIFIILILCIVGLTIFHLFKGTKEISFRKPSFKKIGMISFILIIYLGIMYLIYVQLPVYIGVPALQHFKMEPDTVVVLYILSIVYSSFTFLLCGKILFVQRKNSIQSSTGELSLPLNKSEPFHK